MSAFFSFNILHIIPQYNFSNTNYRHWCSKFTLSIVLSNLQLLKNEVAADKAKRAPLMPK